MGTSIENLVNSGELSIETILSEAKEYSDGYFVHPKGFILSNKRGTIKILKYSNSGSNPKYKRVTISLDSKKVTKTIHRLVAETFIPNPDNKEQVNHINGNTFDNRVENLEWTTRDENMKHASVSGLMQRGSSRYNTNLTEDIVIKCYKAHLAGTPRKQLIVDYGLTKNQVDKIIYRIKWRHITEPLERATTIPNGSTQ